MSAAYSEAMVEAAARSLARLSPGQDWPTNRELGGSPTGTRDDEYRESIYDEAREALDAAFAAAEGSHPAGPHFLPGKMHASEEGLIAAAKAHHETYAGVTPWAQLTVGHRVALIERMRIVITGEES